MVLTGLAAWGRRIVLTASAGSLRQFTGNSACGGDNRVQCAPHERLYSEQCSSGPAQIKCFVDNYCASINKGRTNIAGQAWSGASDARDR